MTDTPLPRVQGADSPALTLIHGFSNNQPTWAVISIAAENIAKYLMSLTEGVSLPSNEIGEVITEGTGWICYEKQLKRVMQRYGEKYRYVSAAAGRHWQERIIPSQEQQNSCA